MTYKLKGIITDFVSTGTVKLRSEQVIKHDDKEFNYIVKCKKNAIHFKKLNKKYKFNHKLMNVLGYIFVNHSKATFIIEKDTIISVELENA